MCFCSVSLVWFAENHWTAFPSPSMLPTLFIVLMTSISGLHPSARFVKIQLCQNLVLKKLFAS